MEHCITHVCGHAQSHYIPGFTVQQERKATWLRTTLCRTCFLADKRAVERRAAINDGVAVASLVMAELTGSERQVAWATGLRVARLAAMARAGSVALDGHPCLAIGDAKWWIDRRDLDDAALLAAAVPMSRAA